MKKLLMVLLVVAPILCFAQDTSKTAVISTTVASGRTRTVNAEFVTVYSPTKYKGFCSEMEYKVSVGTNSYYYWSPVTYFRFVAPFKKRKDYRPSEIYNTIM